MEFQQTMKVVLISKKNSPRNDNNLHLATIMSLSVNIENAEKHLTKKEIVYMKNMIYKNQEIMDTVSKKIKDLFTNGILELHNVPNIILLLFDIYKEYCVQEKISNVSIDNIILFTIHCMIEYNYLPFAKNHEPFVDELVKASLNLLRKELDVKKELGDVKKWWFF